MAGGTIRVVSLSISSRVATPTSIPVNVVSKEIALKPMSTVTATLMLQFGYQTMVS